MLHVTIPASYYAATRVSRYEFVLQHNEKNNKVGKEQPSWGWFHVNMSFHQYMRSLIIMIIKGSHGCLLVITVGIHIRYCHYNRSAPCFRWSSDAWVRVFTVILNTGIACQYRFTFCPTPTRHWSYRRRFDYAACLHRICQRNHPKPRRQYFLPIAFNTFPL